MLQEFPQTDLDGTPIHHQSKNPWLTIFAKDEEGNYKLPQSEVATIKQELVGLMISVPPNIQSQLGDAVGIIADSDFWERWDTLVDVREHLDSASRTLR